MVLPYGCPSLVAMCITIEYNSLKKYFIEKFLSYSLSNERPGNEQMVSLTHAFLNKPGFGIRCMKNQPLL